MGMVLSFIEYGLWDASPSVLPILGGFPLLHVCIHVMEQIGIYWYVLCVAVLDARETGRDLTLVSDKFLGCIPVLDEVQAEQVEDQRPCVSNGLRQRKSAKNGVDTVNSVQRATPTPLPTIDVGFLLDPEVRKNHREFNEEVHQRFPDAGIIRVVGERSCFLVKSRKIILKMVEDENTFSSHPWPDGRIVALNTMQGSKHSRVKALLRPFYCPAAAQEVQGELRNCMTQLGPPSGEPFCAITWAGRLHMAMAMKVLGGPAALSIAQSQEKLDQYVRLNDEMVRLVAPLGGVGKPRPSLLSDGPRPFLKLLWGMVVAVPALLRLVYRIGLLQTLAVVRPELNLYQGPSFPRTGTMQHPELLRSVPVYFCLLDELLHSKEADDKGTLLAALRESISSGLLSHGECLAVLVQLMVNMTTRNAILNALHRIAMDVNLRAELVKDRSRVGPFVQEVLRLDTPLQRLPKRALKDTSVEGTFIPKDSTLLLLLGAANVDPEAYEAPNKFCPFAHRGSNQGTSQIAFGSGSHACLGQHLVLAEVDTIVNFVLDTAPNLSVVGSPERVHDMDVGNFGWSSLTMQL